MKIKVFCPNCGHDSPLPDAWVRNDKFLVMPTRTLSFACRHCGTEYAVNMTFIATGKVWTEEEVKKGALRG